MADLAPTAANVVKYTGSTTRTGTAGATITAGAVLYESASTLLLAQGDSATKAAAVGIALNGGATGQPIVYLTAGGINPGVGATLAIGTYYTVSAAVAGKIAPSADLSSGEFCTGLGFATTTTRIEVDINASGVAVPA